VTKVVVRRRKGSTVETPTKRVAKLQQVVEVPPGQATGTARVRKLPEVEETLDKGMARKVVVRRGRGSAMERPGKRVAKLQEVVLVDNRRTRKFPHFPAELH